MGRPKKTIDQNVNMEDDKNKNLPGTKSCIFCQEEGVSGKILNQKFIPLCREHYQTMNLGKIAQRIRENNGNTPT